MHASEHRPKLGLALLGHVYANVMVFWRTTFLEGLQFINSSLFLNSLIYLLFHKEEQTTRREVYYIGKSTLHREEYTTTRKRVRIHYTDRSTEHYMEGSNRAIHPSGAGMWYDYTIRRRWKFINVTY